VNPRANELVRDAVTMIGEHGFVPTVTNGGKHIKVSWFNQGRRYLLVISQSPSGQHARLKSRAVLRRLLRSNRGAA